MRFLNPIYILFFSIILLVFSFAKLNDSKNELFSEESNLKNYNQIAENFHELKQNWDSKDTVTKLIEKLLIDNDLKGSDINIDEQKNKTVITLNSNSPVKIQKFANKILNEYVIIESFDIQKNKITFEIGTK